MRYGAVVTFHISCFFRYTVTIAGTTYSINYLTKRGYLKTTSEMTEKLKDRKDLAKEKIEEEVEKAWEKYAAANKKDFKDKKRKERD